MVRFQMGHTADLLPFPWRRSHKLRAFSDGSVKARARVPNLIWRDLNAKQAARALSAAAATGGVISNYVSDLCLHRVVQKKGIYGLG